MTLEELKAFLGLIIAMSIHSLPSLRDYWKDDWVLGVPEFAKVMLMHQSFETPGPPPPPGDDRGIAGTFTSCSPNIGSPVVGGYAKSHGLCLPDRGISGAVTLWSAVFIFAPHTNSA